MYFCLFIPVYVLPRRRSVQARQFFIFIFISPLYQFSKIPYSARFLYSSSSSRLLQALSRSSVALSLCSRLSYAFFAWNNSKYHSVILPHGIRMTQPFCRKMLFLTFGKGIGYAFKFFKRFCVAFCRVLQNAVKHLVLFHIFRLFFKINPQDFFQEMLYIRPFSVKFLILPLFSSGLKLNHLNPSETRYDASASPILS